MSCMTESSKKTPYMTDLSDEEWQRIEPHLSKPSTTRGRKRKYAVRLVLDAIFYIVRSGCVWRLLPHDFPPWKTVYYYFRLWRLDGTWERLNDALRIAVRIAEGREPEPSAAIIDSQSSKTTETPGPRGYDAGKKVNGRKRHILVDTLGLLLVVVVHLGNIQDRDGAKIVLHKAMKLFKRLKIIWADGGYAGKLIEWTKDVCGWILDIVKPKEKIKGFQLLAHRWIVERTFGWFGRYRRLSKDYEGLPETSECVMYVAMVHIMARRLGQMSCYNNF